MKHAKALIASVGSILVGVAVLWPAMAGALALPAAPLMADLHSDAGAGAAQVGGGGINIESIFTTIVNILSLVLGAIAIIVIIYSGLKYIVSAGDANKVGSAKNTLIYALIGLAVAALAQIMVHFVLFQTSKA